MRGCLTRGKEGLQKGPTLCRDSYNDFKTSSDDFVELCAVKCYLKVTEEGSPDYFFDHPNTELADEEEAPQAVPQVVEDALNGQSNKANTLEALHRVVNIQ